MIDHLVPQSMAMHNPMKPSEILERFGWVQGRPGNHDVGFCLWASVFYAAELDETFSEKQALWSLYHTVNTSDLPGWNDTTGRTKEEVLAVLRSCGL